MQLGLFGQPRTPGVPPGMPAYRWAHKNSMRTGRLPARPTPEEEERLSQRLVPNRDLLSLLQVGADTVLFVAISVAAGIGYHLFLVGAPGPVLDFIYTGLIVAVFFTGIERILAFHRPISLTNSFARFRDAAQVWTLAFTGLLLCLFALKAGSNLSRGSVLLFFLVGLPLVGIWRALIPPVLSRFAHKTGHAERECILIGDRRDTTLDSFAVELTNSGYPAPTVMRFRGDCDHATWPLELAQLACNTIAAARRLGRGEVFLCAGTTIPGRLAAIERSLSILPRAIYVVPDAQTAYLVRCKPVTIGERLAVEVRREPLGRVQRTVKRLMDVGFAATALIGLLPLFGLVVVAIKLDSKGPALFRQTRLGYRGQPFRIFKFRTMTVQEDGDVVEQVSREDKRVTRVGSFLRKSSIDELPQLLNVLIGQMSLVGPRPHARAHDEIYARAIENYEVRQHVKPGLTGWAQVHGFRGETKDLKLMHKRIEYDLWYAVNTSLLLDIEILVRTAFEVFRGRNAY